MTTRRSSTWMGIVVVLIVLCTWHAPGVGARDAAPQAPTEDPEAIVEEGVEEWAIGGGLLYWARRFVPGPTAVVQDDAAYLRRMPVAGGSVATLTTAEEETKHTFWCMAADEDGVYYHSEENDGIFQRAVSDPYDPPTLVLGLAERPRSYLELVGDHIYFLSADDKIMRVGKDGSGLKTMVASTPGARDLEVIDNNIYWLDDNGLRTTGTSCPWPGCVVHTLSSISGDHLLVRADPSPRTIDIYWVSDSAGSTPQRIKQYYSMGDPLAGSTITRYNAPSADWDLGQVTSDGSHLFWPESHTTLITGQVRRMAFSSTTPDTIASGLSYLDARLALDERYVYFAEQAAPSHLYRLPLDASALAYDLAAGDLEVTQGLQNMAHDVPLLALKETYVRAYGYQVSGSAAPAVEAHLYGWAHDPPSPDSPLPGSPLQPVNGAVSLPDSPTYDRDDVNSTWLFALPESWTESGDKRFELHVNPDQLYHDPVPGNDTVDGTFTFQWTLPICQVYVRTRTDAPLYTSHGDNPSFTAMVDLARRLWPVYEQWISLSSYGLADSCGLEPFSQLCSDPLELPDDSRQLLDALMRLRTMTDDPAGCHAPERTFYVAMIHPATNTDLEDGSTVEGEALIGEKAAWVKLPQHEAVGTSSFQWPEAGVNLAHETGHNAGRRHVDCPQGFPTDIEFYPYPNCQIDEVGAANHHGFDGRTGQAIRPDEAADVMSYGDVRWISDHTWEAIYDSLEASASEVQGNLPTAGAWVYVSGAVNASAGTGVLDPVWVYPDGGLSAGIRQKWQRLAAEAAVEAAHPSGTGAEGYRLRFLAGDSTVLAEQDVLLTESADDPTPNPVQGFVQTLAAPAGTVVRVELLANGTVLDSRQPGTGQPTVSILQPAGGEMVDGELDLSWQASDPDAGEALVYNVHYSPDDGQTWYALLLSYAPLAASETVSITISDLPSGSEPGQARIRVAASDGLNTGLADSAPFSVAGQPPLAHITAPYAGETVPAGLAAQLRGGAMDAEDGPLGGEDLSWTVGGQDVGQGEEIWLHGWAPGPYNVVLTARDSEAKEGTAQATLTIAPLGIPLADAPLLDGYCDDGAYSEAAQVRLHEYDNGMRPTAYLVRSTDQLWACFTNLETWGPNSPAEALLRLDPDYTQDAWAGADDYTFAVGEDGAFRTYKGGGGGTWQTPGPGGLEARVSANENGWNAELRIDAGVLGGWGHAVGLAVGHDDAPSLEGAQYWPAGANAAHPTSWGKAVLGTLPWIEGLEPAIVEAGGPSLTLEVSGWRFVDGAQVRWDGASLATTYVSSTTLEATVTDGHLADAGEVAVTVRNPGGALESNEVAVAVRHPVPRIGYLSPNWTHPGDPAFRLRVCGTGFGAGASVLWNSTALPTTDAGGACLEAEVAAALVEEEQSVAVAVLNPGPGGRASRAKQFLVQPTMSIHLPTILRNWR